MMDTICPPSTVFAAYNAYGGSKEIVEYAYNEHDGGGELHEVSKVEWLRRLIEIPGRTIAANPVPTAVSESL
jgi:cephalosporin-C deacetylase